MAVAAAADARADAADTDGWRHAGTGTEEEDDAAQERGPQEDSGAAQDHRSQEDREAKDDRSPQDDAEVHGSTQVDGAQGNASQDDAQVDEEAPPLGGASF